MKGRILSRSKGFTLVELMIVVAIAGAIISIVVPRMADLTKKARQGVTKGMLGVLRSATSVYIGQNDGYFPYLDTDLGTDNIEYITDGESVSNDSISDTMDSNPWVPTFLSEIPLFRTGERNYFWHEDDRDIAIVNFDHILSTQPVSSNIAEWIYIRDSATWRVNWAGPDVNGESPYDDW